MSTIVPAHLLNAIYNKPTLITPEMLRTIVEVVSREQADEEQAAQIRAAREERPAAIAMRQGHRLEGTSSVTVRDGVAHVPIIGPIVRRADWFTRVSGLTSSDAIGADFATALAAPNVRAILLELDSPGGEVTGIAALGDAIYEARAQKPIVAYVDGMAASAGYWLASAASRIVIDPAGMLGSIGAVLAVRDPNATKATSIEFVSSQSPYKRANPTTDDGRAQYQRIVDQTAEVFVEKVARNRATSIEHVLANYGQGGMLVGKYAVQAGLADQIGAFEPLLAELADGAGPRLFRAVELPRQLPAPARAGTTTTTEEDRMSDQKPVEGNDLAARVAALEAQLSTERAGREQAEAEAKRVKAEQRAAAARLFVSEQKASGRIVPAQEGHLLALYEDVADRPAALTALTSLFTNAPRHTLTKELLPADEKVAAVLPMARSTEREAEEQELKARAERTRARHSGNGRR